MLWREKEFSRADVEPLYLLLKSYKKVNEICEDEEEKHKKPFEDLMKAILCSTSDKWGIIPVEYMEEMGGYPIQGDFDIMLHNKGYSPMPPMRGRRGNAMYPRRNMDRRYSQGRYIDNTAGQEEPYRKPYHEDGTYYNDYSRMYEDMKPENYPGIRKNYNVMQDMPGMKHSGEMSKFTQTEAKKWLSAMENMDGTTGPKYTMEQTNALAKQVGVVFDKFKDYEWNVVVNMMYSDYCETAKHFGVDKPEYYAHLAKNFLFDDDSVDAHEKIMAYYNEIVKPAM